MTDNLPAVPVTDLVAPRETVDPVPSLALFREAIAQADAFRAGLAEQEDLEALAYGFADLRKLAGDLKILLQAIEDDVIALMPDKMYAVEGLGTFEKRGGSDRKKWDSDDLLDVILRGALDPEGDGTLPESPVEVLAAIRTAVKECIPITPSLGWRLKALRERGIDPDEYSEKTPGRVTLQIHGGGT